MVTRQRPSDFLPDTVLQRSDFISACEDRDLGGIFRIAKKWAGFTASHLCRRCEMSVSRVNDYAKGHTQAQSLNVFRRVSDGLHIPGAMLGLERRPWEAELPQPAEGHIITYQLALPRPGALGQDVPWEVAELSRRLGSSDVGPTAMETIEAAVDQVCSDYPHVAAPELYPHITGWLQHVVGLTERRTTLRQHRDLLVSAGWLFLIGGCVEYDMGWRQSAELSRTAALNIARETGHGEIAAWAWEMEAWFALTQGRYHDVMAACDAGHSADSTHSVGVQLYAQQAKAYARLGDSKQVRLVLDAGRSQLERLPRPTNTNHHFVIDPDKWDFYEMDAYRLLGNDERATTHAREVLRLGKGLNGIEKSPMRMAEARLTLGVASARSGELEEAVVIGTEALGTERKSLPSLFMVATELSTELRTRFPREQPTREFQDHISTLIRESTPPELAR
jgi:tetratricopeptide (TPR) repeat protein